jgi:hypothetical protein
MAEQPSQQPLNIQDHVNNQKAAIVSRAQELVNVSTNIVDSWLQNFMVTEKIKSRRTEQVNQVLGFVNQLANEGLMPLNQLGAEVKDPEISNKILECNNLLMNAARNLLSNIQAQEDAFQKEIQQMTAPPAKTEVKVTEA